MVDVVQVQGDVASRSVAPPVEVVRMAPAPVGPELLPQGDLEDVRLKRISNPIEMGEDGAGLKAELRKREADPITEWRAADALPPPGESESTAKQLRKASESMTLARKAAAAQDLVSSTNGYITNAVADAAVSAAMEMPPTKVLPVADAGPDGLPEYRINPLIDNQPIKEADSFRNLNEAARAVKNWRSEQERYQQNLITEFTARQEQDRLAQAELQRIELERATPKPQPTPQPDPAVERARVQAQQAQLAQLHQMQVEEREAVHEQAQIKQFLDVNYPPQVRTPEGWRELQRVNPGHAAYLAEHVPAAVQRYHELHSGLQQAALIRQGHQAQVATVQKAQFDRWASQQDDAARAAITSDMPEYSSDAAFGRLQKASRRALEKVGLSKADMDALWANGTLRHIPAQRMIAKLAHAELQAEARKELNAHRAVPRVQAPGTYQPRGAGDLDQVRALERQLDGATGQQALKIARQLTQARRAAGLL